MGVNCVIADVVKEVMYCACHESSGACLARESESERGGGGGSK